jgi:hypothetical protein
MKDIVVEISKIFNREAIDFIVIGALARDIYFEERSLPQGIKTRDVDFAILVKDWDEFKKIKELLKTEKSMKEDPEKSYRLLLGEIPIDLIPFGDIAGDSETIKWPRPFRSRMKVMGFNKAFECAVDINLADTAVKVIIPEMLIALKLSSWCHSEVRRKDAVDIKVVLQNVKTLCPDLDDDFHEDRNESLFEKYIGDEDGLWISIFASRIQFLLAGSDLSAVITNMAKNSYTMKKLLVDMNNGNIPDPKRESELLAILTPFIDGLIL